MHSAHTWPPFTREVRQGIGAHALELTLWRICNAGRAGRGQKASALRLRSTEQQGDSNEHPTTPSRSPTQT